MSDATANPREEQILGRLAELDLALAERVHARAMAAEDVDEINSLSRTYQRLARSVRQTLLAKAKLTREREAARPAAPRETEPHAFDDNMRLFGAAERNRIERAVVAARPYVERERPDYDDLDEAELYEVLIGLALHEDFLDTPMDALIDTVLEALGYQARGAQAPVPAPREPPGAGPVSPLGADPPIQDSA